MESNEAELIIIMIQIDQSAQFAHSTTDSCKWQFEWRDDGCFYLAVISAISGRCLAVQLLSPIQVRLYIVMLECHFRQRVSVCNRHFSKEPHLLLTIALVELASERWEFKLAQLLSINEALFAAIHTYPFLQNTQLLCLGSIDINQMAYRLAHTHTE